MNINLREVICTSRVKLSWLFYQFDLNFHWHISKLWDQASGHKTQLRLLLRSNISRLQGLPVINSTLCRLYRDKDDDVWINGCQNWHDMDDRTETNSGECPNATSEEALSSTCVSLMRSSTWWRRRFCQRAEDVEVPSRTSSRARDGEELAEVRGLLLIWDCSVFRCYNVNVVFRFCEYTCWWNI